ncbi:MAG: gliding motility-associated C-terminal domain-containing protein [Bacteroidetes bacterium]|nr:gliding motility-associated C-terminal domain-containing protein [Bacteroidota bacterium]
MKRFLPCFFVLLLLSLAQGFKAQVFWTETFGTGCTQGNFAAGSVATASNGAWAVTPLATGPGNGADANEWFISATEAGMGAGNCGDGCLNTTTLINRTLHIGSNLVPFFVDPGAAYLAGGTNYNTNARAESPTINCTGQTNITLSLNYLVEGVPGVDYAELLYSANNGGTWAVLGALPVTNNGPCAPQGNWTPLSVSLPASANSNAAVKIGVRWESSDPAGADPSIAVDDIVLSKAALTFTIPASACVNQTVQATVTGTVAGTTSYSWSSTPAGGVFAPPTSSAPAVAFSTAGAYTVTVFALNSGTVIASAIQTITVNASPTVAIVPATQTICSGNTATMTANATAGSSFQWATGTFPAITLLGTSATQTASPTGNATYTVLVSIGSCTAFATSAITVAPPLVVNATASSTQVCIGGNVTLTGSGANTYTWASPSNPSLATTATVVVSPTVNTTYTVTGSNGVCTASNTISIATTSNVSYTVSASSASVCPGQPVNLTVTGGVNYTWSPGSSLSTTSGSAVIASPVTPTTYTVIGNDGAGCSGSGFITINMGSAPNLQVIATATAVCTGFSSTLTGTGATSYTWTGTTFTNAVNQSSVAVGPGTYSLNASNGSACASKTVITMSLAPPLNITASQNNFTTCIAVNSPSAYSKPVILTASGGSSYNWAPCDQYISICLGPVVQVRPPTSRCYTVTGNTSVCSGSAVVCVTVIPQFTITVTPPLPIMCTADSLKLKVANIGTLSVGPYTYNWADPEPISIYNQLDFSVTAVPSNTTTSPRSITYTTEVKDSRGCISVARLVTVTVIPRPLTAVSVPTINGVRTNTICFVKDAVGVPDVTLTLTANNTNSFPPQYDPTFTWVPSYTTTAGPIITQNPTNGPVSNIIVSAPLRLPTLMVYTVVSGFNGIPGCRREDTVTVRVIDCRPVTPFTFTTATVNDTICTRECVTFLAANDTTFGGPQTFTWTFPGGNPPSSNLENPTVCYNLPGKYNVILRIANPYPKSNPTGSSFAQGALNFIKVVDIPNPRILPNIVFHTSPKDTIIRFASSIVLTATNAASYIWSPPYNISALTGTNVTVNPLQTTQYIVKGYNSSRCFSSDTINVRVTDNCGEMFVPNAFSPNNDGANDILYVRGQCLQTLTFMVFNRWGEKVFESNDKNVGWDGTYKGEPMNTGVFVFRLEGKTYDGKGYTMKGNVTLVR